VTVQLSGAVEQDLGPKDWLFFNPDKVAAQAVKLLEDFNDSQAHACLMLYTTLVFSKYARIIMR
jgi:hypothetical protein